MSRELTQSVIDELEASVVRPAFLFEGSFSSGDIRVWTGAKDIVLENLITYSEEFSSADWTNTRSSISADDTTGPLGTGLADKLVEDASSTTTHYMLYSPGVSVTSGTQYRFSVFAKKAGRDWIEVHIGSEGFPGAAYAFFDLNTGSVGTIGAGIDTATIADYENGWYLCTVTATADATHATNKMLFYPGEADNDNSYTGDGSSGVYIWGASFNQLANSATYLKTIGTAYAAATFQGNGWLADIQPPSETNSIQKAGMRITLNGVPATVRSVLLNNTNNRAVGKLWFATLDSSWDIINNLYLFFTGYLDGPSFTSSGESTAVALRYESRLASLNKRRELRYTNEDQRRRYPDDKGMEYVVQSQNWKGFWGKDNERVLANFRRRDRR